MFQESRDVADRSSKKVLDFLYIRLSRFLGWGSVEDRLYHSVMFFGQGPFTYVVDGSEQPVLAPEKSRDNLLFYSAKKKKTTINILVYIRLDGRILHLSSSYPGCYNDNIILRSTDRHLWESTLERYEYGLGDKGFQGMEDLGIYCSGKKGIGAELSRIRIRIEQRIEVNKDWRACKETLRLGGGDMRRLLDIHHKIWTVVSELTNDFRNFPYGF